ncbi:Protein ENHANCED DISEASE RESISTANCE 4 [Cardamine amara subsp. amara]|uniref:Protein ENHANCED DISEASE RESISTANCE 4 n=1 Tax=Cardamine amara subsp. amara TaxID=228776 RepID=A0ABD0ZR15_CARAN
MASQTGKKIRLVKCPKCFKILQEDEDVPVYQCGGCSTILQAKKRNIAENSTPSARETERVQASEPRSEPETNNVSSSSGKDKVLPSSSGHSSDQECEKGKKASVDSMEKELGGLELSKGDEIQQQERSLEVEDNSRLKSDMINTVAVSEASSRSLSVDHVVAARVSNSSGKAEISPDASPVQEKQSHLDSTANKTSPPYDVVAAEASVSSGNAEISPDASPDEEKQSQIDYPANKTSSAYDGSESSCDEREDQLLDDNEQWNALQKIRSDKFEMLRYPGNYKDQGASSSSTFSEKRRNGITTNSEWHQNRSLQLEGPGGRLGRQGRRHVTEQLRPDMPLYPREQYRRISPSYPSHDEFDRYSRAHSLQMPPYTGGMNQEYVDYMYHTNTRARGRGHQVNRFSGEMGNDRRNHGGWYSGQLHNNTYSSYSASPQRPMEQPEYYPRYSHEIVSDMEDHQRNTRHHGHHHHELELQNRRLQERQRVAKRHIRPTAGGAPFVSCYRCSENLQLPVDFLIFKRKHHLLRCGTCTTVLRFSLQLRTHLVPDISANRSNNSRSESPRDRALSKSEKQSSSVQDEELPVTRGSPLHRLMGYSTVSQVFKASQRPPSV